MQHVNPADMRLPAAPIARPGERVSWFVGAQRMTGIVLGHDKDGLAIIRNDFGTEQHARFDDIRLEDPFARSLPNWHSLPTGGQLLKPSDDMLDLFRKTVGQMIPPGATYVELAREIWGRGFEIFLVGGTVRDILAGQVANDVDFVTTMPLERMRGFLQQMFRTTENGANKNGYIRLGGTPASGDPFIDLKVFSTLLPGSNDATFGVGFDRDISYRDFTCNCVYYDPINEVIVDPTGQGVSDCENKLLRLVEGDHSRHQMGQVFIRAVKFAGRGFELVQETHDRLLETYLPHVAGMKRAVKMGYLRTQVMSKHRTLEAKMEALATFKATLLTMGCTTTWKDHFDFADEELQDGR